MPHRFFLRPACLSLAAALFAATTVTAFAMPDKQFLVQAIKGDNSEVMLGQLAERKGASPAVRSFGATLDGDHAKSRIRAKRLADLRGLTSPRAPTSQAAAEDAKLKRLRGAAFDREFTHFMIKAHEKDIAAFRTEAHSSGGPVARFARMSIPMLEHHLQIAERLAKSGA